MEQPPTRVGFIGLGTMGRPMCLHIAAKAARAGVEQVIAYDADPHAMAGLTGTDIVPAGSVAELVQASDAIHVCLPGGEHLAAICNDRDGLLALTRAGQLVIDHGTSPVPLTRQLAQAFAERNVSYADAPITRTRAAAEAGTLVTLFGGPEHVLERVRGAIETFSSEIVHCGEIGTGQIFKQLNNMVLFQTVTALAEALATARRAGVDGDRLFAALSSGSADSFALCNHGMKALLPGDFPERAFAVRYALKDLDYAIELARSVGLELPQASATQRLFEDAIGQGLGETYFPAVLKVIDRQPEAD